MLIHLLMMMLIHFACEHVDLCVYFSNSADDLCVYFANSADDLCVYFAAIFVLILLMQNELQTNLFFGWVYAEGDAVGKALPPDQMVRLLPRGTPSA